VNGAIRRRDFARRRVGLHSSRCFKLGFGLGHQATEQLKLSARGYYPVLKVARTHADLDAADGIARLHVAEALSYRRILLGR
jgi:predicted ATPase with chaperone activity